MCRASSRPRDDGEPNDYGRSFARLGVAAALRPRAVPIRCGSLSARILRRIETASFAASAASASDSSTRISCAGIEAGRRRRVAHLGQRLVELLLGFLQLRLERIGARLPGGLGLGTLRSRRLRRRLWC